MPRCDEHGHYDSRCPDCARVFGHDDCEDTAAELRADVERLMRELREARAYIRETAAKCDVNGCHRLAARAARIDDGWTCDAHASPRAGDLDHAPAIRAAEGET